MNTKNLVGVSISGDYNNLDKLVDTLLLQVYTHVSEDDKASAAAKITSKCITYASLAE